MLTDRNLRRSAIIGLAVTGALTFATVSIGALNIFDRKYTVTAEFADGGAMQVGAPVRVAGIRVGSVSSIERDLGRRLVEVEMSIDGGVDISEAATASIDLRSMLGAKYVEITDPFRGELLADGDVIPIDRTETPVDLDELLTTVGEFSGSIDVEAVNRFLDHLAGSVEGQGEEIGTLIDEVGVLADALADRSDDLDRLIVASERLLGAVDGRREELGASLDQLAVVFDALSRRRDDITGLVDGVQALRERLVPLLAENRGELDSVLEDLVVATRVLDRQRERISLALDHLPLLAERYVDMTDDGPWINVFFVGTIPGPYVANPVLVGPDGALPGAWFDPQAGPREAEVAGTRAEFEEEETDRPPPEGYPGR